MRRRTPAWLIAFFAFWPVLLLVWLILGSCSDGAAVRATRRRIETLASDVQAISRCPQMIEFSKSELLLTEVLCSSGTFRVTLWIEGRPNERVVAELRGPFRTCVLPPVWSERFTIVASVEFDAHDEAVTCYEHESVGR